MTTAAQLKTGQRAVITALGCSGALRRRLLDMGVLPGQQISMEKVAPLGDPLEIRVKGCSISLRRREAGEISVEVLS